MNLQLIAELFQELSNGFSWQSFHWPHPSTPSLPQCFFHAAAPCCPLPCCVPEVKYSTMSEGPPCELPPLKILRKRSVSWYQMMFNKQMSFLFQNFLWQLLQSPRALQNGMWVDTRNINPRFHVHVLGMRNHKFPHWSWCLLFPFSSFLFLQFSTPGHVLEYISKIPSFLFLFNLRFHGDIGEIFVNWMTTQDGAGRG